MNPDGGDDHDAEDVYGHDVEHIEYEDMDFIEDSYSINLCGPTFGSIMEAALAMCPHTTCQVSNKDPYSQM